MDNAGFQTTFDQAMNLWFLPEIEHRQAAGKIPQPYELRAAQIIFHADERPHEIRLNEEVQALAKVKFKEGITKEKGEIIFDHEIEHYELLRLPETEDPNCGHLTVIQIRGSWHLFFDFIYNKGRSKEVLQAAKEFLDAAEHALAKSYFRALVDNLFSAAELAATAFLTVSPYSGRSQDTSHGQLHSRFNLLAKVGAVETSHRETFNSLASIRKRARYVKGTFAMTLPDAMSHLAVVKELIEHAETLIERE
jgi:hypothetical protein